MILNEYGEIVHTCWLEIPRHFPNVILDAFIVMPNHIHGIVVIENDYHDYVGNADLRSLPIKNIRTKMALSKIIHGHKSSVSRKIKRSLWQRSFYDHIIRNEQSLQTIREYIRNNPLQWLKENADLRSLQQNDTSLIKTLQKQFKNKKILIVGLGLQGGGVGLVKFFAQLGARVTVTDLKKKEELRESLQKIKEYDVTLRLGQHRREDFLAADVIFKGPSVPWTLSQLRAAMSKEIPIEMEASFFAQHCPCPIIGVTGTRGKSTTAAMIYALMKKAGFSVFMAGNVPGVSTITLLEKLTPQEYVVLELSSWQLSGFHQKKISPHIAVFTNVYPDHLNFYDTMEDYFYDKKAIYHYQKSNDYLVADEDMKRSINPPFRQHVIFTSGLTFQGKLTHLKGSHNEDNAALAYETGKILKIDSDLIYRELADFKPLSYRLEKVAEIAGVAIYNDSTSTTPIACQKAIETFEGKHIILICGGNSKKLPFDDLINTINRSVDKIILLKGSFTDEIVLSLDQNKIVHPIPFDDIQKTFSQALEVSRAGDVILFSPGATSFAMFKNEFHRGREFDTIVHAYKTEKKK